MDKEGYTALLPRLSLFQGVVDEPVIISLFSLGPKALQAVQREEFIKAAVSS